MAKNRISSIVAVAALAGLSMLACSKGSGSNPLGSSAGSGSGGSGGSSVAVTSSVLLSSGVLAPWNGIAPVQHIQTNETAGAGPVNPLTGAASLQVAAAATTGCLPTTPPSPCVVKNSYQTNGSYRLATCRPTLVTCPAVSSAWQSPHTGGSIQFDLQIDVPLNDIGSVYVYYGNPGCSKSYRIPDATVASAIGAFVRVSIPLTSFAVSSGCPANSDVTIFQLDIFRNGLGSATAAIMDIDNIIWTN